MVYDCFAFFNELDLLEIRLHELDKVVDKFVLVEATRTFQKNEKPLYFEENKTRFEPFLHKIEHVVVQKFPNFFYKFRNPRAWDYDNYQKDQIAVALKNCQPDDIILYSDLDEIPKAEKVTAFKNEKGYRVFQMRHYYYYINGLEVDLHNEKDPAWWYGTVMCSFKDFKSVQKLRIRRDINKYKDAIVIADAGWHFAYLGGIDKVIQKINAYAHTEHNKQDYKNPEAIRKLIEEGKGLYNNEIRIKYMPLDESFPANLLENKATYSHLVLPL